VVRAIARAAVAAATVVATATPGQCAPSSFLRSARALPRAEGDGGEWRCTEPKCTCTELKPSAVSLDESSSGPAHGVGTVAVQACGPRVLPLPSRRTHTSIWAVGARRDDAWSVLGQ